MKLALTKEINKEYLEAAKYYEGEIASNKLALPECYINLAFLYWGFAFELFEFSIPNNIPDEWREIGGNRYSEVLDLGLNYYPNNLELNFWKRYYAHIIYGEDFSVEDCEQLLERHGSEESNVPYFFLYLFDKQKYQEKRDSLLNECHSHPIAKNLYIKSIIESR